MNNKLHRATLTVCASVLSLSLATGLIMTSITPSWAEFPFQAPNLSTITDSVVDDLIKKAEKETEVLKTEARKKANEELEKQLAKLDQALKETIRGIREKAKG